MTISQLPEAPSRANPSTFSERADALLSSLATFVTEANALAVALNLNSTTATSTTSLTIEIGSKSLTVDINKSYQPGMSVKIAQTSSPSNWMHGDVTSYDSDTGTLVVDVTNTQGSGSSVTDWTITLSGPTVSFTGAAISALLSGADAKTTLVDADMIGLLDSAEGNILKKLSWSSIKASLKSLFLQAGAPSVSDSSGTIALDFATYAGFYCILSGTGRTVTFTNPTEGQVYRLLLIQGSGGSKTITTWPTMTWLGGGSAPTLSTTEGKADAVTIWYVNGVYYGSLAKG